jgi:hypothetical protein
MSLLHMVMVLIVIGVLLWLVNNYMPMAGSIKKVLNIVVFVAVVIWVLKAYGILSTL